MNRDLIRPDRQRTIERPFSWVPFRLLTDGYLAELRAEAKLLYFILALVADRRGVSFYSDPRLAQLVNVSAAELQAARLELCERDLLAYDARTYQLLSLPTAVRTSTSAQVKPTRAGSQLAHDSVCRNQRHQAPSETEVEMGRKHLQAILKNLSQSCAPPWVSKAES